MRPLPLTPFEVAEVPRRVRRGLRRLGRLLLATVGLMAVGAVVLALGPVAHLLERLTP